MNSAAGRFEETKFFLWMRVFAASISVVGCIIQVCTNFNEVPQWASSLSIACFFAFFRTKQPGESPWIYITNPRVTATVLSALVAVITSFWWLVRFAR